MTDMLSKRALCMTILRLMADGDDQCFVRGILKALCDDKLEELGNSSRGGTILLQFSSFFYIEDEPLLASEWTTTNDKHKIW